MNKYYCLCGLSLMLLLHKESDAQHPIKFDIHFLTIDSNEGCDIADFDNDGKLDIVAGRNWYRNDDWLPRPVRLLEDRDGYVRSNGEWAHDVNNDGLIDVISMDFVQGEIYWYENPGTTILKLGTLWPKHLLKDTGYTTNEASYLVDLDGDSMPEWITNQWNKTNPAIIWKFGKTTDNVSNNVTLQGHRIGDITGHGIGFGDVNNDGRKDVLLGTGWYEQPETDAFQKLWNYHPDWDMQAACPMIVHDVDGDGINDVITSKAHDFGIYLWRGLGYDNTGKLKFQESEIDSSYSQAHCLHMADLNGDGQLELITGKRVRAHNGGDPGASEPPIMRYYVWNADSRTYEGHTIDKGLVGIGLQIRTADVDGDGDIDIVVAGKEGTQLLINRMK